MQSAIAPFAVLLALFGTALAADDYCDPALCPTGKHIACNNDGKFGSKCIDPREIVFTQEQKDLIAEAHNEKRNIVAGGKSTLQPACRMGTIQWDDELASLAALNVKQCDGKQDECHNTNTFKHSGQNIVYMERYDDTDVTVMAKRSVGWWYNEIEDTKQEYIDKYPRNHEGHISQFTVMMADKNIRVGCAAIIYNNPIRHWWYTNLKNKSFVFVCNYAAGNVVDNPIYKSCTEGGSECTSGKNPDFPNLCSTSEVYDVNKL